MMLPATAERVETHTDDAVNQRIQQRTEQRSGSCFQASSEVFCFSMRSRDGARRFR